MPLLIFTCTIKSRSSLLAPAHPGGPGKRAVKRLWCGGGGGSRSRGNMVNRPHSFFTHHRTPGSNSLYAGYSTPVSNPLPEISSRYLAPTTPDRRPVLVGQFEATARADSSLLKAETQFPGQAWTCQVTCTRVVTFNFTTCHRVSALFCLR